MRTPPPNLALVPGTAAAPQPPAHEGDRPAIVHVAGGDRSLATLAPVVAALEQHRAFRQVVVATGQQSDTPAPGDPAIDHRLGVGAETPGLQTARVLSALEPVLAEAEPAAVVVAGEPSATLACALAASKLGIAIAHLESGLRSHDRTSPEELGRVLTDRLADTLFAPDRHAAANLTAEGIAPEHVHVVGDPALDSPRRKAQAGAIPLRSGRAADRIAAVLVANYALTAGARDGGGAPAL